MKKYLLPVCLLSFSAINFISCYQDDEEDFFDFDDLSISRHTTLTRSGMNEPQYFQTKEDYYYFINTQYPKEENCCYLTVIMERWIAKMGRPYFSTESCTLNANNYYQQIKGQLQEANPGWTPGQSLNSSTFIDFADDLTYTKGNTTANLFSDLVIFSNIGTSASTYLSNEDNCQKVTAICVEKVGEPDHIAYVTKIKSNKVHFKGYDFLGDNKYTMDINGESGWSIAGVILK